MLSFVSRSLFKADRLMWAMALVRGMHPELFQDKEWELFVGDVVGDVEAGAAGGRPKDFPAWAAADRAPAFRTLAVTLPGLVRNLGLGDSAELWARWGRSVECEQDFPPVRGLTAFQRLLVVQALRPGKAVICGDFGCLRCVWE